MIEDTGRVTYREVPDDKPLDLDFVAPELQESGAITEKVRYCDVLHVLFVCVHVCVRLLVSCVTWQRSGAVHVTNEGVIER